MEEIRQFKSNLALTQEKYEQLLLEPSSGKCDEVIEYTEVMMDPDADDEDTYIILETTSPVQSPTRQIPAPSTSSASKPTTPPPPINRVFSSWDEEKVFLEEEMRSMGLLVCNLCKAESPDFAALRNHFQDVHQLPGYIFCCKQKFGAHTAHHHIQFHKTETVLEDDLSCDQCGKKFLARENLNKHQLQHTPLDKAKGLACDICGRLFRSRHNLRMHCQRHVPLAERDLSHTCHICGKGFDCKSNLSQHLKTHEKTESEECPICQGHFFNVKRHIQRLHTERKMEVCTVCGLKTARLASHMRHSHTDTGERYPCEVCGKEFRLPKQLRKHTLTHTGYRVKCHFCPHAATTSGNLVVHMKSHHPSEYQEWRIQRLKERKFKTL